MGSLLWELFAGLFWWVVIITALLNWRRILDLVFPRVRALDLAISPHDDDYVRLVVKRDQWTFQPIPDFEFQKTFFYLDVYAEIGRHHLGLLRKYGLLKELLYVSPAAQAQYAAAEQAFGRGTFQGTLVGLWHSVRARNRLHVTVGGLVTTGVRIRSWSLHELVDLEETVKAGAASLQRYIAIALSFNGEPDIYHIAQDGTVNVEQIGDVPPVVADER